MKLILTLTLSLLLSACASTPSESGGPGLYHTPVGSIVKLNRPLTIPAGKVRAGVQFGKLHTASTSMNRTASFMSIRF